VNTAAAGPCRLPSGAVDAGTGPLSPAAVVDEVVVEARALEAASSFPREAIERVRAATSWMAAEATPGDVRQAAQLVVHQAATPVEPQLWSPGPLRRLVKQVVHRLIGWYVRVLAQQVKALGEATARVGLAVAERTERLQAEAASDRAAVSARLDALGDRVARLEAMVDGAGGAGGAGPAGGDAAASGRP